MRFTRNIHYLWLIIIILYLFYLWTYRRNNQKTSYESNNNDPKLKVNYTNRFNKILRKDLHLLKDLASNLYGFDILKSQELPLIRDIPDTRPLKCQSIKFDSKDLQPVSIIIPVFNEFYSVLLRTVYTIFARSPNNLISEIILIDDHSMYYDTKLAFEHLKKTYSQVIIHRLNERRGLIKAKILGETLAKSKILIYMDSHTEVNVNWLEPLILEISANPMQTVAIPTIDSIDPESFEYIQSPVVKGGFNWGLFFTWVKISDYKHSINSIDPILTPTFSGGYFAISKEMYEYFGGFDPQMKTWGGENLEMSFRIWQCGGQIKILPCSRLGHIFRSKRPYGNSDSGDHWLENTLRMAHVWIDGYIEKFFKVRPEARNYKFGNIRKRKQLRETLKCNSFKWYLENVYPEMLN